MTTFSAVFTVLLSMLISRLQRAPNNKICPTRINLNTDECLKKASTNRIKVINAQVIINRSIPPQQSVRKLSVLLARKMQLTYSNINNKIIPYYYKNTSLPLFLKIFILFCDFFVNSLDYRLFFFIQQEIKDENSNIISKQEVVLDPPFKRGMGSAGSSS